MARLLHLGRDPDGYLKQDEIESHLGALAPSGDSSGKVDNNASGDEEERGEQVPEIPAPASRYQVISLIMVDYEGSHSPQQILQ